MKTATKPKKATKVAPSKAIRELADIFGGLADTKRLMILQLLMAEGRMCVSDICEALGEESQPAVSHHLKQLQHARLVDYERDGKFNIYYVDAANVRDLLEHFFPLASRSQQALGFGDLEVTFKTK